MGRSASNESTWRPKALRRTSTSMAPKLRSEDGRHIVIRPLAYVPERDIERYARAREFPIIPCTLCGSQENLQRQQVAQMLRAWQRQHPGRVETMFTALQNVVPSHLMDARLHDFKNLQITGMADPDGDIAFDEAPLPAPASLGRLNALFNEHVVALQSE